MSAVTFLTDFGESDAYAAEMKGSFLSTWASLAPGRPYPSIIDVTHAVPRHDVHRAATILEALPGAFPAGTVHVVVVDPGVGSPRRPLAVLSGGQRFLGPDNGCLTPALEGDGAEVVALDARWRRNGAASRVFDGRDLFAPAAAALLAGTPFTAMGERIQDPVRLARPGAQYGARSASGVVVTSDHFGNVRTSLQAARIPAGAVLTAGTRGGFRVVDAYAELGAGEIGAVRSSNGSLELAIREGDASAVLGLAPGDPVTASW